MTQPSRIIGMIADIHAGSAKAVCDDTEVRLKGEEQVYLPQMRRKGQVILHEMWKEMIEDFRTEHVDTLIINGDVFEGSAPWSGGRESMVSSIDIEEQMAYNLLRPLVQVVEKVHMFSGTPIHESRDSRTHAHLAKSLSHDCPTEFHGFIRNLKMTPTDTVVNVAHKATGAMIYTATVLDRESLFMMAAEARDKVPQINVVVRAHLHSYLYLDNGYHHTIQLPCWKAWFPFKGAARLFGKMQPDIGYVLLKCYDDGAIEVKRRLWNAPEGFGLETTRG